SSGTYLLTGIGSPLGDVPLRGPEQPMRGRSRLTTHLRDQFSSRFRHAESRPAEVARSTTERTAAPYFSSFVGPTPPTPASSARELGRTSATASRVASANTV